MLTYAGKRLQKFPCVKTPNDRGVIPINDPREREITDVWMIEFKNAGKHRPKRCIPPLEDDQAICVKKSVQSEQCFFELHARTDRHTDKQTQMHYPRTPLGSEGHYPRTPLGSEGRYPRTPLGSEGRYPRTPLGSEGRYPRTPLGSEGRYPRTPLGNEGNKCKLDRRQQGSK